MEKFKHDIAYLLSNFIGAIVEVWEWRSNFLPHFIGHVIVYPCWDFKLNPVRKMAPS